MTALAQLLALKAHLETITTANGYPLTVGTVAMDRDALAVGSRATLPMITLLTQRDVFDRQEEQGDIETSQPFQAYRRIVEMEGWVDASVSGWEVALETLLSAVRLALVRYPRPLRMTPPAFLPPDQDTASFVITLYIPYEIDLTVF